MGVDLGSAYGSIVLDAHGATRGIRDAQAGLEEFQEKAMRLGAKLSIGVTAPLLAMGKTAVGAASDLSESINKVSVVFDDASDSVLEWSKNSSQAFGLSRRNALEAAGTFGNLFTSMGMATDESAGLSMNLVELAGDLASFNNIDPTVALEKLRAGLVGEVEPLRTLGVNLNQAAVEARAMELGLLHAGEEMSAQIAVQARYSLILDQTKNAQGDFARTADGMANSMRTAKADIENAMAVIGESLMPKVATAAQGVSGLAEQFASLPEPIQNTVLGLAGVAVAAGPVMSALAGLSKAVGLLAANPTIGVIALVAALALWIAKLQAASEENERVAGELLDSTGSYAVYEQSLKDAGVEAFGLSEALYEVYKAAKRANDEMDAVEFQKAADSAAALAEGLTLVGWETFAAGLEEARGQSGMFLETVGQEVQGLSDLELGLMRNEDVVRSWGMEIGMTGTELDLFVTTLTDAAWQEGHLRARMAETTGETIREREALAKLREAHREYVPAVEGAQTVTWDFTQKLEEMGSAATSAGEELKKAFSASELVEALSNAGSELKGIFDTQLKEAEKLYIGLRKLQTDYNVDSAQLLAEYNEEMAKAADNPERRARLAAEYQAETEELDTHLAEMRSKQKTAYADELADLEYALAQKLAALARGLLAGGEITASQYAEIISALTNQFGSLVDPAQTATDKILSMFGQWALGAGVTAEQIALAVDDIKGTMDRAVADADAATIVYEQAFLRPHQPVITLGDRLVTLGQRISELPDNTSIWFSMPNYAAIKQKADDIAGALNNIPTEVNVHVNIVLTGNPNILPLSPHTMMEYALENLAETAKQVENLHVNLHGDGMPPGMVAAAEMLGGLGGSPVQGAVDNRNYARSIAITQNLPPVEVDPAAVAEYAAAALRNEVRYGLALG